jgi:hypothetical protein
VKIIFLKDLKRDICVGWAKVVDFDLKSCEGRGRKEVLIKIITFQKKSNVGNDTLFTLYLSPKGFFV